MHRYASISLLLLALGCTELDDESPGDVVVTDWDRSVDFTAFSSYQFVTDPNEGSMTVPLPVTKTRNAIRAEFDALGYTEMDGGDLGVIILTETESSTELQLDCLPGFYWYGYTGGYNSCLYLELSKEEVTVGTILVGMGDASSSELVFNGMMQGIANGQDTDERIIRAVGRLFNDYPADQTGS